MTAASQDETVLSPEDIEYLIAFLRTNTEPVTTEALVHALRNRQS